MTTQTRTAPAPAPAARRGTLVFALACIAISGACWGALLLTGESVRATPGAFVLFALGASGPSLAALVAVLAVRRSASRRTTLRPPWAWAPLAIVLPALPAVVVELVLDPGGFGADAASVVAASGGTALFLATYLIAGPLAEEFGWRGYLQPRLRLRFGPLATAAIIGAAWSAWHLPLFLLPGTGQHAMGLFTWQGLAFVLGSVPLSVTLLLVSERLGGGVIAAILAHFSVNVSLALLPQPGVAGAFLQLATTVAVAAAVWWWGLRGVDASASPAGSRGSRTSEVARTIAA